MDPSFGKFMSADPDSTGSISLLLVFHPVFPLAMGVVECMAGLDVQLKIEVLEALPSTHTVNLVFSGKIMDLSLLQMKIQEWEKQHPHIQSRRMEVPHGGNSSVPPGSADGAG